MNLVRCKVCGKVMIDEESTGHSCPISNQNEKATWDILNALAKKYIGLEEFKPSSPEVKHLKDYPDKETEPIIVM